MQKIESETEFDSLVDCLLCVFGLTDARRDLELEKLIIEPREVVCGVPLEAPRVPREPSSAVVAVCAWRATAGVEARYRPVGN